MFTFQLNVYTVAISSATKIVIIEWLRLNIRGFLMQGKVVTFFSIFLGSCPNLEAWSYHGNICSKVVLFSWEQLPKRYIEHAISICGWCRNLPSSYLGNRSNWCYNHHGIVGWCLWSINLQSNLHYYCISSGNIWIVLVLDLWDNQQSKDQLD